MIPDYEKALSIYPTFFFLVIFLIMSAVYYNRYHSEESDERALRIYRDYVAIMNSQSLMISVINGLIIIVLYNDLLVGITLLLVTQALAMYVFIALYMKSHIDTFFFLSFSVLAYVYEFLYFMFSGVQANIFGRTVGGLGISIIVFIIIVAVLSAILAGLSISSNKSAPEDII